METELNIDKALVAVRLAKVNEGATNAEKWNRSAVALRIYLQSLRPEDN